MVAVNELLSKMDAIVIKDDPEEDIDDIEMEGVEDWEWSYDILPELAIYLPRVVYQIGSTCLHNSIITAFETKLRQNKNIWENLSREHIVAATQTQDPDIILSWLKNSGVAKETSYSSQNKTGDVPLYRIKGYRRLNVDDPQSIIEEVMSNGPVIMALLMFDDFLELKSGDIYEGKKKKIMGEKFQCTHAVCVIGGGFDKFGERYYTFLNSWGNFNGTKGLGKTYTNRKIVMSAYALDLEGF